MNYPFKIEKGKLHRRLGIPETDKIPMSRLRATKHKAQKDHDTELEREAQFAINAHYFRHRNRHT